MSSLYIIVGEIGVGKTTFTKNFAQNHVKTEKITLVDLDTSNLYFRLSEFKNVLQNENTELILPNFAHSTQEVPSISPNVEVALKNETKTVIVDTSGGDFGITTLNRFKDLIEKRNAEILYIVNQFRSGLETAEKAANTINSFEKSTGLRVKNIVNNSHLGEITTAEDVLKSAEYAKNISKLCKANLLYNCVSEKFLEDAKTRVGNIFPIKP